MESSIIGRWFSAFFYLLIAIVALVALNPVLKSIDLSVFGGYVVVMVFVLLMIAIGVSKKLGGEE